MNLFSFTNVGSDQRSIEEAVESNPNKAAKSPGKLNRDS